MDNAETYRAYLLRIWRDVDPVTGWQGPWHFSLERPGHSNRRGFRSLAELAAFLQLGISDLELSDDTLVAPEAPPSKLE
jgi:hypothetical protein